MPPMSFPVIVTGAAGFIGMHLCRRLLAEGRAVVGIDNLNDYYDPRLKRARLATLEAFEGFTFHQADVSDRVAMAALFDRHAPRQVVHLAAQAGAKPIAVVSSESKYEFCTKLGAVGCINRKNFDHWGRLPHWESEEMNKFTVGARAFGKAIWDVLGERRSPRIVFEHPGQDTIPTSQFVCDTGGMIVICAGTTGYNADVDLRYLWMRQKRLQGSHFANDEQSYAFNKLVHEKRVDPCLSRTFAWNQTGECHQLMYENRHPDGNMAILVGAPREGMTTIQ